MACLEGFACRPQCVFTGQAPITGESERRTSIFLQNTGSSLIRHCYSFRLNGKKATLNIKPIMCGNHGVIEQKSQAVGMKKAISKLAEIMAYMLLTPAVSMTITSFTSALANTSFFMNSALSGQLQWEIINVLSPKTGIISFQMISDILSSSPAAAFRRGAIAGCCSASLRKYFYWMIIRQPSPIATRS